MIEHSKWHLGPIYNMDHEVGPWKMEFFHGQTSWSNLHVRFLKKTIYKAFGPLIRCKPNVDQEEWSCTKSEIMCWILEYMSKKDSLKKNSSMTIFCLLLSSSSLPPKISSLNIIMKIFLCHGPLPLFYENTCFASPTAKPIGPCRYII